MEISKRDFLGGILLLSVLTGVAYAATSFSIGGTGTVTTKNWKVVTLGVLPLAPTCSATLVYNDTPASITWGSVATPSTTTAYICVQNTDINSQSYTTSSTLTISPTTAGSITTSPGTTVASGGLSLVSVTLTISSGVADGTAFTTSTLIS